MKRTQIKKRPLSDTTLANLEPEEKEYRELDSDGLYFRVKPDGNKSWQLRYKKSNGKYSWLGLGGFKNISGAQARVIAEEWRKRIKSGIDPTEYKLELQQEQTGEFKFQQLAIEYCNSKTWTDDTRSRNEGALRNHVYPVMGKRDYREITKKEWYELIQSIQKKPHPKTGKPIIEMGNRVKQLCQDAYSLAEVTGRIDYNPLIGLEKFLEKHITVNMPHVSIEELPDLIRSIRAFPSRQTSIGLQLSLLLGCRPSEIRKAVWTELNADMTLWTIPSHRMKKRIEHKVPLPKQAIELLHELKTYSGDSPYLFRGRFTPSKPISNNTFGNALKDMGYTGKQTPHGFRHILSTSLREKGFQRDYVESALAHKLGGVEGTYNKAIYLEQRRVMMQSWANHLDALADGQAVVQESDPINELSAKLQLSELQLELLKQHFESTIFDNEIEEVKDVA
ncbi:Integrase [Acinetobacter marinus]|uniref:Integrase n=1 Tax=Acinetobacter marinus TaxID=281375 RepID=A0A1G6IEG3_9GAMM|nr:tyrosine-type recombinase/integrase [Acinetobacter marinus]SDC04937.1 Integrase [Acinetobacter marinus]